MMKRAANNNTLLKSLPRYLALSAMTLSIAQAWAEEPASKGDPEKNGEKTEVSDATSPSKNRKTTLDKVKVTGKALSVQKSIAEKRAESVISDGVSADEVGSIPDFGLGEAIQRIPGVSMLQNNNRGEAQFMTIRGFNPDYSTTLVDGIALPATETTRRIVSLDILPSSLPRQVTVFKTNTPDMESNAIAGTVNLRTRSAFDSNGLFASVRGDYAHWENERNVLGKDKPSGQVEGVISNVFGPDDQFGFVLSGNYYRRESSSLNTASTTVNYYDSPTGSGAAAFNQGTAATSANNLANTDLSNFTALPTTRRWLEYDNVRERQGLFAKLEFDNHGKLKAHATAGYFQHTNNEFRWAQQLGLAGTINRNSATTGSSTSGSATADLSNFVQTREVKYLDLGGSFMPTATQKLDAGFNVAEGSYRQDNTTIAATQAANTALATSYVAQPGNVASFSPASNSAYLNPSSYLLNGANGIIFQPEQSSTLTKQYKLDFSSNMEEGNLGLGYKTGVLLKNSDVNYDINQDGYNSTNAANTLAATGIMSQSFQPYNGNGQTMLMLSPTGALNYFAANPNRFTANAANLRFSTVSDFSINERNKSAYLLGSFRDEKWNVILGGRYETMDRDITNKQTINSAISGTVNDSIANYRDATVNGSEHHFLPSINASCEVSPSLKLRGAVTQTLGMPSYSQLAQNGAVAFGNNGNADIAIADGGTATVGRLGTPASPIAIANPNLKSREANNFDLSTEWYLSSNSLLSMALFRKDIKNEIVTVTNTSRAASPFGLQGTYDVTTSQAVQTNDSQVLGIELAAAKTSFDFLPFPFNLFGATANMTMLDMNPSSIRMNDGSMRKLPQLLESPKEVANTSLLFNYDRLSAQLSYIYTGKMPRSFNANNSANDVWYAPTNMLDMQVRYRLDKRTNIVFQGKNLTDEKQDRLWGPNQSLLAEQFQNGRSFYLGFNYVY